MAAGTKDSFCTIWNKDADGESMGLSSFCLFFFSVRRVILPTAGGSLSISLAQTRTSSQMWPQACFWESLDGLKTGTNNQLLTVPGFT